MKQNGIVVALIVALIGGTLALGANGAHRAASQKQNVKEKADLAREAQISLEQAREIALKRVPGRVESGELEREHGQLVYSFDIRNAKGSITEVQVNAINGKIVSVKRESRKHEAAEKRQDKRTAKH